MYELVLYCVDGWYVCVVDVEFDFEFVCDVDLQQCVCCVGGCEFCVGQ